MVAPPYSQPVIPAGAGPSSSSRIVGNISWIGRTDGQLEAKWVIQQKQRFGRCSSFRKTTRQWNFSICTLEMMQFGPSWCAKFDGLTVGNTSNLWSFSRQKGVPSWNHYENPHCVETRFLGSDCYQRHCRRRTSCCRDHRQIRGSGSFAELTSSKEMEHPG
jgi:hypothetical protein